MEAFVHTLQYTFETKHVRIMVAKVTGELCLKVAFYGYEGERIYFFRYTDGFCLHLSVPSFLASFLPSFYPSFHVSLLSFFLPSFFPFFLPSFLPSFLSSFLPSFFPSFLPSFLPSFVRAFIHTPELLSDSFECSFIHSFIHSFVRSFIHSHVLVVCLRFLMFCLTFNTISTACKSGIGLEDRIIPDSAFTASSSLSINHSPGFARLNHHLGRGAWCSSVQSAGEYLQVDLNRSHKVNRLDLQAKLKTVGSADGEAWITGFTLKSSENGSQWADYIVSGSIKV